MKRNSRGTNGDCSDFGTPLDRAKAAPSGKTESDKTHPAMRRLRMATLERLSLRTRQALSQIATTRSWQNGDVLFRAGEVAGSAVVCDEGRLRIWRTCEKGTEHLSRGVAPGELLGIASVIGVQPFHFSVTAAGPCRTTHFGASDLRQLMRGDGQVALEFAELLARRIVELSDVMVEEYGERLDQRLYATLVRLSKVWEGVARSDGQEIRISQSDLASMVGSSRQYVNPTLKRLAAQGLIRLGYRSIVLLEGHEQRAGQLPDPIGFPKKVR
ncbi:Crp/Fnr family transcriptional regulator (plasmid) [Cupriavidus pinatubonensis]|uniref:Crp/Fnr family transcriptional regulator n=1 Tax=Cupriavidus pinatubonensis TaxID=248026 RepID=UPI001C7338C1|nr:Crp/Fnr family transcriptional regulator [Cupriavidus pinatubonensis]QYY34009.1 Crp/Fnr family transcriptional regulator [Cupriavidus pinatubonensis]